MKITGFDKVNEGNNSNRDESLEISIYDLFNSKFLNNHTSKHLDTNLFLHELGIENEDSISDLNKSVLDEKVKAMTDLCDWDTLVNTAALEFLKSDVYVKDISYDNVPKKFGVRTKLNK